MTFHKVNSKITNLKFTAKESSNEGIVTTVSVDAHLNPLQIGTLAALQDIGHLELSIESDQSTMDFDIKDVKDDAEDAGIERNKVEQDKLALTEGQSEDSQDADDNKGAGKKKEKAVKS